MTRPYVQDKKDKIVKMAKDGLNAAQISERFGFSRQSITTLLNKAGFEWDRSEQRWVPRRS